MHHHKVPSKKILITIACIAFVIQGCALFVSHYDAGAYQQFTSLKAFHVKFIEDHKVVDGRTFDEYKTKEVCDAGELKFREASEYAAGRKDDTRVKAISYLHNVFTRNCRLAVGSKKLFSADYADQQIKELEINYDYAIEGEIGRVGAPSK